MISTLNILRISLHQFIFFGKKRRKKMEHVNIMYDSIEDEKIDTVLYFYTEES